jgi:hypothetical protein
MASAPSSPTIYPLPAPQAGEVRVWLTAVGPGPLVLMCDRESDQRESDLVGV